MRKYKRCNYRNIRRQCPARSYSTRRSLISMQRARWPLSSLHRSSLKAILRMGPMALAWCYRPTQAQWSNPKTPSSTLHQCTSETVKLPIAPAPLGSIEEITMLIGMIVATRTAMTLIQMRMRFFLTSIWGILILAKDASCLHRRRWWWICTRALALPRHLPRSL